MKIDERIGLGLRKKLSCGWLDAICANYYDKELCYSRSDCLWAKNPDNKDIFICCLNCDEYLECGRKHKPTIGFIDIPLQIMLLKLED